jgi:hypothetical protein
MFDYVDWVIWSPDDKPLNWGLVLAVGSGGCVPGLIRSHPEGVSAADLQPSSLSRPLMS